LEHDRIAKRIQAPDEPLGNPVVVSAIPVVSAEFVEAGRTQQISS
jgi:hypothetical protein